MEGSGTDAEPRARIARALEVLDARLRAAVVAAGSVALAGWLFGTWARYGCLHALPPVATPM